jgi:hypothetical protein
MSSSTSVPPRASSTSGCWPPSSIGPKMRRASVGSSAEAQEKTHELPPGLGADRMERMGHERLARPRLAVDQHVPVGLAEVEDVLAQPLHHRRRPDELLHDAGAVRQLAPERPVVEREAARGGRLLGQLGHAVGVEGLLEEVVGADLHRLDRHRHVAVAGDEDDGQPAVDAHQLLQERHAVHAGHLDVGDDDARIVRAHGLQRLLGAGEGLGVEARERQPLADRLAHVLFVVDDRDLHRRLP